MEWTWGWAAVLASAAAAGFAAWQAWEARRARVDASKSETAARDAAESAASAQRESAEALADIARIAREQHEASLAAAARKPDPWRLQRGRPRESGDSYVLLLGGDEPVYDVELTWQRAPRILHVEPDPVPSTMRPGEGIEIGMWRAAGDERPTVLEVYWRREGDLERNVTRSPLT